MASINLSSHTVIFSSQCRKFNCFNGLHSMNTFNANGITSDLAFANLSRKPCLRLKGDYKARATLVSGEGGLLSYPEGNADVGQSSLIDREREKGVEMQPDAVAFGTLATDVASTSDDVFVNKDELDLDYPTEGFSSIPEAIEDIRQGKLVIVVDDEDRENEGDLIMAASLVTTATMAFIVKHGTGIVCVSMKGEDLERLELPLMVATKENDEKLCTAFTVSVDAKHGTTTGVSAHDRATTVLALASKDSKPEDFNRPGLDPVAILCEIVDDDGSMARLPKLRQFAQRENLKIISIADLIRYRRKRDKLVERASAAPLPLAWGAFRAYCYKSLLDGMEHIAMVKGEIGDGHDILVRVHSECLTGDIFGSAKCDCGNQLALAMKMIETAGRGVLVYLRGHEGRGIGLGHKLRAYNLQDDGRDTVEANEELGLPVDSREYGIGAQILRDLGVRTMRLMTNNPSKYIGLKGYGLEVVGRVPLLTPITEENRRYLETKRLKMGHIYNPEFNGHLNGHTGGNGKPATSETSNADT